MWPAVAHRATTAIAAAAVWPCSWNVAACLNALFSLIIMLSICPPGHGVVRTPSGAAPLCAMLVLSAYSTLSSAFQHGLFSATVVQHMGIAFKRCLKTLAPLFADQIPP